MGFSFGKWGKGSSVKASATSDGVVTKSDDTELDFDALYIDDGCSGTIIVSRDGGTTSSPPYAVSGPQVLAVSGDRVMAASSYSGGNVNWMQW
jgi:hypothetical protein